MSLYHRLVLTVFFSVLIGSHVVNDTWNTFPFVTWAMYNRVRTGNPKVYDYQAKLQDGTRVPLSVAVPALGRKPLFILSQKAESLPAPDHEYRSLIRSVAKVYEKRHPGSQIQSIAVSAREIPLDGSPAQRRFLWEVVP
jgi:hypothetical protein